MFDASLLLGPLGAIGGAVARFVAAWQQQKAERERNAHELAMLQATAAIEDRRAEQRLVELSKASEAQLAAIRAKGDADTQVEETKALALALQAQLQPTGIRWVDALSSSVRPVTTYYWTVLLYGAAKVALVVSLFSAGQVPEAKQVAETLITPFDESIIGSILGYWFVDRSLRKGR